MAYIRTISEADASGDLAAWYARVGNPDGTVDNVMKIHSIRLTTGHTHFEMYKAALHGPSSLSRMEREMVATVVSRLNGCTYCLRHHGAGLQRLLPEERQRVADDLATGRIARLEDREQAMVTYATRLTTNPQGMTDDDVQRLRDAGLDDEAILDLAQVVGYFNYVNRIVTGLGVSLGEGEGAAGQWPEAD